MDDISGKTGPAELMHATACMRLNPILDTQRKDCTFSIHPLRLPSASEVTSPTPISSVEPSTDVPIEAPNLMHCSPPSRGV